MLADQLSVFVIDLAAARKIQVRSHVFTLGIRARSGHHPGRLAEGQNAHIMTRPEIRPFRLCDSSASQPAVTVDDLQAPALGERDARPVPSPPDPPAFGMQDVAANLNVSAGFLIGSRR